MTPPSKITGALQVVSNAVQASERRYVDLGEHRQAQFEAGCTDTTPVYADSHVILFQALQPTIKKHLHWQLVRSEAPISGYLVNNASSPNLRRPERHLRSVEKGASRSGKDTLFLPTLKAPARKKLAQCVWSTIGPRSHTFHICCSKLWPPPGLTMTNISLGNLLILGHLCNTGGTGLPRSGRRSSARSAVRELPRTGGLTRPPKNKARQGVLAGNSGEGVEKGARGQERDTLFVLTLEASAEQKLGSRSRSSIGLKSHTPRPTLLHDLTSKPTKRVRFDAANRETRKL